MNDKFTNKNENEEAVSGILQSVAQNIEVNTDFQTALEKQLTEAHKPARISFMFSAFQRTMPTLGWIAALAFMILMLNWIIRSIAPPPVPAAQETATASQPRTPSPIATVENTTPMPDAEGYTWRGSRLYLSQPLPTSPAEASVYQLRRDQQVTLEEARALARRFGLAGDVYTTFNYAFNVDNYYFTDGKQGLEVYSNRRFIYTADLAKAGRVTQLPPVNNAEQIIRDFLSARGFDFPFKITPSDFFDRYSINPLAPDGLAMQYESFTFPPMLIQLDENNQVLSIDATLLEYEPTPLGTYGIISAQEALNILMNDNEQVGKQDFFHSAANPPPQEWYRQYPDNQIITIRAYSFSVPHLEAGKPPFITIDGVPAVGNIAGLAQLEPSTLIEATGEFRVESGIRQFNVESWDTNITEDYVEGTLRQEGDQIILTNRDGSDREYAIIDPPADLPLNTNIDTSLVAFSGVIQDGQMDWYYIQFYEDIMGSGGGGGGGGGLGFYQLNLSGTPIPFPTPTTQTSITGGTYIVQENDTLASIALNFGISVEEIAQANGLPDSNLIYVGQLLVIPGLEIASDQRVDNVRGFLSISIQRSADGSQTTSYLVFVPDQSS
ncbi:MAG TPA: LysM domain-containing protein, partial [Anaerolineales bacterium]|nr:LysM domain-containing protein [Anaerolineales bacterium]